MRKKILIVEDEPEVRATLVDQIRSFGYDAAGAADAETALAMLRGGETIDLVITDMRLPGMNGIDLLGEIKRAGLAVPVVLLTGHCSVETFLHSQSRGAYEYVNKPVRATELKRIIGTAVAPPPSAFVERAEPDPDR